MLPLDLTKIKMPHSTSISKTLDEDDLYHGTKKSECIEPSFYECILKNT